MEELANDDRVGSKKLTAAQTAWSALINAEGLPRATDRGRDGAEPIPSQLLDARLASYASLFELTEYGPKESPRQLADSARAERATTLRNWYYVGVSVTADDLRGLSALRRRRRGRRAPRAHRILEVRPVPAQLHGELPPQASLRPRRSRGAPAGGRAARPRTRPAGLGGHRGLRRRRSPERTPALAARGPRAPPRLRAPLDPRVYALLRRGIGLRDRRGAALDEAADLLGMGARPPRSSPRSSASKPSAGPSPSAATATPPSTASAAGSD
jgi:hypothetical protein